VKAGLDFHAAAPGAWVNDPNGLFCADGAYRLFAQHSSGAEDRRIGWCRWSSKDLLRWTFDGAVIPPEDDRWMYSGSVLADGDELIAFHTVHQNGLEHQAARSSSDAGTSWSAARALDSLGPPARNRRDPFVFKDEWGWGLLLAEPCDWTRWREQPASRLRLYRSPDRERWHEAGVIGPWRASGVMWEVPVLARIGGYDVLFISEVDRRDDFASCSVRAWVGRLDENGFTFAPTAPAEGQLVDFGPDFYALISSGGADWPLNEPVFVAWASCWANARTRRWPNFNGGPITLPRTINVVDVDGSLRLKVQPAAAIMTEFSEPCSAQPACGRGTLDWSGTEVAIHARNQAGAVSIKLNKSGQLHARRHGAPHMAWQAEATLPLIGSDEVVIFLDGPLIELFVGGTSLVVALEQGGPTELACTVDSTPTSLTWTRLSES